MGSAPPEAASRRLYVAEGVQPSVWENGPGDTYAVHEHGDVTILRVVRGSIRVDLPRRTEAVEPGPGDRLMLLAGVAHSAAVGPGGVTCLEAHRPTP